MLIKALKLYKILFFQMLMLKLKIKAEDAVIQNQGRVNASNGTEALVK